MANTNKNAAYQNMKLSLSSTAKILMATVGMVDILKSMENNIAKNLQLELNFKKTCPTPTSQVSDSLNNIILIDCIIPLFSIANDINNLYDIIAEACIDVATVTKSWGSEITWSIGCPEGSCTECINEQAYDNNAEYAQECCFPKNVTEFEITCTDSYGDGWHGGYLDIRGDLYCENFHEGHNYTEALTNGDNTGSGSFTSNYFILNLKLKIKK